MITIEITDGVEAHIESSLIERAVNVTLANQDAMGDTSMTVVITNDHQIHELNRQFRNVDAPTDVLSFTAGHTDPESGTSYIGDVIISYPQAAIQAGQGGHTIEDELQLLVVHGTLHLFGYDHANPEDKDRMWAVQAAILDQLNVSMKIIGDA